MKRTPLKQHIPLNRYTPLKAHKGLNRMSDKQKAELKKRHDLKAQLIVEHGEHCMTCLDKNRDWRGITLSHIIPLSRGGKTTEKNCLLECFPDHELYEKRPQLRKDVSCKI